MKNTQPIKLNRDFRRLYARGKSAVGGYLVAYMRPNRRGCFRVGFTVSKHLGNAVTRNRVKRLMRESYRLMEERLEGSSDIIVVARGRAVGKTLAQISGDMEYIFGKLGILGEKTKNNEKNTDSDN